MAPTSPPRLVKPAASPAAGSEPFRARMQVVGDAFRQAGVAAIYLVHGTFVGHDALGFWAELGRVFPAVAGRLRDLSKAWVDGLFGERGNYSPEFARLFEDSLHRAGERRIPVRLFQWSSENHHLGRADGAVRLADELLRRNFEPQERVLLWGHSHAGNVFALLTNLLGGDREARDRFFQAARVYYRCPVFGCVDVPLWNRVRLRLLDEKQPALRPTLDVATFGTPIRYGWDSGGYERLLHFIHHRPAPDRPPHLAPFPPPLEHVLAARDGDYVQQAGIAGTNVRPSVFAWRSWWADRRLNGLLQPDLSWRELPARLKLGMRVPEEGETLLVDYGLPEGSVAEHHAGHAVYTASRWMLFHAETIAAEWYGAAADG